jgi:hypothetical protein
VSDESGRTPTDHTDPTRFLGLTSLTTGVSETKGRSYVELDELFERKIPARKFRNTRTTAEEVYEVSAKEAEAV